MMVGMNGGAVCALPRGQQHRERVFVPGEDQAEDRGGGDAGGGLRQHHLHERLQARVAVDHRGLLVLARDLVDEALEQPDGEADVDRGVEQDQAELGVGEARASRYIRKIGIATAIGGMIRVERMKNSRSSLSGTRKREKA